MTKKPKIILLSGGLDSTTLLYDAVLAANVKVHALLVHYKSRHNDYELSCAKLHCRKLNVNYANKEIDALGGLTEQSWIVPVRNPTLLLAACHLAMEMGYPEVLIGCNKDDAENFPDCRSHFIFRFNMMLSAAEIPVQVVSPYIEWTKRMIAEHSKVLGVEKTSIWTCYAPAEGGKPCGECPACKKLEAACGQ